MASPSEDRLQPVLTNQQREEDRPLAAALELPMGPAVEAKPREPRGPLKNESSAQRLGARIPACRVAILGDMSRRS